MVVFTASNGARVDKIHNDLFVVRYKGGYDTYLDATEMMALREWFEMDAARTFADQFAELPWGARFRISGSGITETCLKIGDNVFVQEGGSVSHCAAEVVETARIEVVS